MSNPIKIGVVGLGRIGMSVHRECLKERPDKFTVVAACDLIADRSARYAEEFGCRTYERIEDLIADPEVEVVDIATITGTQRWPFWRGKAFLWKNPSARHMKRQRSW